MNCVQEQLKKDFSNTPLRAVKKDSALIQLKFFEL